MKNNVTSIHVKFRFSGNGFMHPSLPPSHGRRLKRMRRKQERMMIESRNRQNTSDSKREKRKPSAQLMIKEISFNNRRSKKNYMQNSLRDCEKSSKFVTDDVLRSFGVLASDCSVSV